MANAGEAWEFGGGGGRAGLCNIVEQFFRGRCTGGGWGGLRNAVKHWCEACCTGDWTGKGGKPGLRGQWAGACATL
ncbi:hypothetical protein GCM10011317_26070 [Niveispirillum cyanobacteriorum]|nr:hypothetical protein GCM10011317_26070 [Niveispirillum cyanobacteriorum]